MALTRKDIKVNMSRFPYPKDSFWISTGAALVLHGVRDTTNDIDIGCEKAVADVLIASGCPVSRFPDGGKKIVYSDCIEVFENWGRGDVVLIDGLPVLTLDSIISIKKKLGREKDFRDISLIEEFKRRL